MPRREIEETLRRLPGFVHGIDRPLEQLDLLAHDRRVVLRDAHGLLSPGNGQRLFDFDPQQPALADSETEESRSIIRRCRFLQVADRPTSGRHATGSSKAVDDMRRTTFLLRLRRFGSA